MSERPKGVEALERERERLAAAKQRLARQRQADAQARADAELEALRGQQARLKAEAAARRAAREAGFVSVPELIVWFAVFADAVTCVYLASSFGVGWWWGLVAWAVTVLVAAGVFVRDVRS